MDAYERGFDEGQNTRCEDDYSEGYADEKKNLIINKSKGNN
jgi:hypothetical protein